MNIDRAARQIRFPWQKREDLLPHDDETQVSRRVALLKFLPLLVKNHLVAIMGEFAGTFPFLLFALGGTNALNTAPLPGRPENLAANPAKILFISLCFGFSLAVNAWVFFRISGGLFNPAVSLGMMIVGAVPYLHGCVVIVSQLLGGIAAAVVSVMLPVPLNVRTSLGGVTSVVQGLFIEMFLMAQLVFTIFMLAAEKHRTTFIAPIGIGLSLFVAELFGVYYTETGDVSKNSPSAPHLFSIHFSLVCKSSTQINQWFFTPVTGSIGSLLASAFYMFINALEYETVNPDQDAIGTDVGTTFDPSTGEEKPVKRAIEDPLVGPAAIDPMGRPTHTTRQSSNLHTSRIGQMSAANINSSDDHERQSLSDRTEVEGYGYRPSLEDGRSRAHHATNSTA